MEHRCQCPCGTNQFSAQGEPIVRFFCHCTICQDKYQAPFADVTLFKPVSYTHLTLPTILLV